jgi:maltose alpha-D-glucosyltransferase / alpha-amylase
VSDRWYKHAIIYCVDVETFADSNDDGIGDFVGLTKRLDYLAALGVTCLWLLPFYPSPNRDNGYDVADYYGVDARYGCLGDFVEFVREARSRGMRVLVDLVVNHTSDQHPWFQAARQDPNSPFRDYYVWSEERPEKLDEGVIFPGVQDRTWSYDEAAGAWYFHRFMPFQPDLNITSEAVRREICKIMGFWLELGVAGFRVDAAPFLVETKGVEHKNIEDPHAYLRVFSEFLSWRQGDAIMLAEANEPPEKMHEYVGDGDKMDMLFNFLLNQYLFLAVHRQETAPLLHGLRMLPELPETFQWAVFLRNHDELSLDKLSEDERQELFAALGPEPTMQIYDRGLRRRLAPMLPDKRRLAMVWSLLFALPGTPVIWYGDEIGMGEDLSLEERNSVRTPMQWTGATNGGFSRAAPERLVRPVIDEGPYGYPQLNVAAQHRDPQSLLNHVERLISTRKQCPEIGWGSWQQIEAGEASVLVLRADWRDGTIITLHNLSDRPCDISLGRHLRKGEELSELLGDRLYDAPGEQGTVALEGYGFRWFRLDGMRHAGEY